jgi:iron complex transport system substrate-binding protein
MKLLNKFPTIFSVLLFVAGCQNSKPAHEAFDTVKDMSGRTVEIPKNIQKVVGVKAGALRLLSYLDAGERIAGVEEIEKKNKNPYNFANPEYKELPGIGPIHGGDAELIALAKPDVIFMTYSTPGEAEKLQNKTGIPVIALQYGDLNQNRETFYSALRLIARVIHKTPRADSLINFVNLTLEDLNERTEMVSKGLPPKVYVGGISFKGAHGISSTAPEYAPFEYIHTNNLAAPFKSSNNNVSIDKEQLIEWNPEKIFIDYAGWGIVKGELEQQALAQILTAAKTNELYLLFPYNWYTTNYATILVNSYFVGSILFPGAFSDVNIEEKANTIYKAFLNKAVYHEMVNQFGDLKQAFITD